MTRGSINLEAIAPDMLSSTFGEIRDHTTLGAGFNIGLDVMPEQDTNLASMPEGTKVFIRHEPRKHATDPDYDDPAYDAIGVVLGHTNGRVKLVSLRPKDDGGWGVHNAYGASVSEVPDALAALDRIFTTEFGSTAVMSETTGLLLGENTSLTIGLAGCNSHEPKRLASTLTNTQLLDRYSWKPVLLQAYSALVRRDDDGAIIHYLPGKAHPEQPPQELRDQRGILDRIDRLTTDNSSALNGLTPAGVLRGLEAAFDLGVFMDRERPVASVAATIKRSAESIVL